MSTTNAIRHANAVGVVVADMATTLAFYRRCGLAVPDGVDDQPHVDVPLGGGFRLMFDTVEVARSIDPTWEPPTGGARMSLAIECASPDEVDALHADLVAAGHESRMDPFDAFWGQRYAIVVDPDGNPVDLYAASAG